MDENMEVVEKEKILSKTQMKKLAKRKKFEDSKEEWKEKMRQKKKERKEHFRQNPNEKPMREKKIQLKDIVQKPKRFSIAIDLSYDEFMTGKSISSLCSQLMYCYAANRRIEQPVNLSFLNFKDKTAERLAFLHSNIEKWDVILEKKSLEELNLDLFVYLTADSENILTELDETKTYIIGGLIDRNHHKGISLERAKTLNIPTAALNISQFTSQMKSSKVLATNHVFQIILNYVQGKDWESSFFSVIPKRKLEEGLESSD